MATKNTQSSCYVREYDGFEGIDRARRSGGLADIVNLRLASDKTLTKREAAVKRTSLGFKPRAHYAYDSNNLLVLAERRVFLINMTSFSQSELGSVNTYSGGAQFLCYDGKLLLLDGNKFYLCNESGLSELDGYAPLYGKGWHPRKKGAVHQPMNLLSRHYRISYTIDEDNPKLFDLDMVTESVDAAYLDGTKVSESRFAVNDGGFSVNCSLDMKAGSELTLYMSTATPLYQYSPLKSCLRAESFGDGSGRGADVASIVFYGGSDPTSIFCTRRISKKDFDEASKKYTSALSIYVTSHDKISVGGGRTSVKAICRRGENMLIFTSDSAFVLKESDETANLFDLSEAGGCSSTMGVAPMGDSPVTVSESGILKWSPVRYDSDEYVASCISLPISGLPSKAFFTSSVAHANRKMNELWFTDPGSVDKRVFIYNFLLNAWYSFSGISADSFFDVGSHSGFFSNKDLYLFDSTAREDSDGTASTEIVTKIKTGRITFGDFEHKKRLFKFTMSTAPQNSFRVTVTDAEGKSVDYTVSDASGEETGFIEKRINQPRSRYYSLTVTGGSPTAERLCGMTLTAAK